MTRSTLRTERASTIERTEPNAAAGGPDRDSPMSVSSTEATTIAPAAAEYCAFREVSA